MRRFISSMSGHVPFTRLTAGLALGAVLTLLPGASARESAAARPRTGAQGGGQTGAAAGQDAELQKQIAELRAQLAKLQAALEQQRKQTLQTPMAGAPASSSQAPGRMTGEMGTEMGSEMGMMPPGGMRTGEMGGMGSGGMAAGQMGGMSGGGMGMMGMKGTGMDMHKGEMGMPPEGMKMPEGMMMGEMGMGRMSRSDPSSSGGMSMGGGAAAARAGGMSGMPMGGGGASAASPGARASGAPRSMSSLPGMPGASHVYHIGSTAFFLDQPQLTLSAQQQASLNRIKERALLERANAERRIEQAEQELWALTGADQPDATKVQAKLEEIEQLRTAERLGFIRAVGEASKQLTPEQQNVLLGTAPPAK